MSYGIFEGDQLIEKYANQQFLMILCFISIEKSKNLSPKYFLNSKIKNDKKLLLCFKILMTL